MKLFHWVLLVVVFVALTTSLTWGQTQPLPGDLVPIAASTIVPRSVNAWWSIAHYGQWPPCPMDCGDPGDALYYSMSIGPSQIFIDDRSSSQQATRSQTMDDSSDDSTNDFGGGGEPLPQGGQPVFGTNLCLFLAHSPTNWVLSLSNTVSGLPYEVIASPVVTNALSNWMSMGIWLGDSGNTTPITVILSTNVEYFFDARLWALGRFPNGTSVPTNGQILLELTGTNSIQAMVNGVSNAYAPFYSNYVLLDPPIYSLNLGYDGSDTGPTNSTTYAYWTNQGIQGMFGFSSTLTNLCLAYNPLSQLDVHGFAALQDLECWHCTNLLSANITNCPALLRVCLEASDLQGTLYLSGDTNLQELRAASQGSRGSPGIGGNLHNIVFGGAGPYLWHLCAHENEFTNHFDFTQFPSLKQLWFWNANQGGPLVLTNAPNLMSVQVMNNNFTTADFHGNAILGDIEIGGNTNMTYLNIAGCGTATNEIYFLASSNNLPQSSVDAVLTNCVQLGYSYGGVYSNLDVYLDGNTTPSVYGLTAIRSLDGSYWTVHWSGPPTGTPAITNVAYASGSNTAAISWTTDIASDSTVYYGTNTSYGSSNHNATLTTSHSITLSGLTTNTQYHFYVASATNGFVGNSWDYEFTTLGAPAISFVSSSAVVNMFYSNTAPATLIWYWGDGSSETVTQLSANVVHDFGGPGPYTNLVTVSSSSALCAFGVGCLDGTTLTSVSGLNNFPDLQDAFFYLSGVSQISLAGCSNLVHIALAGCNPTPIL